MLFEIKNNIISLLKQINLKISHINIGDIGQNVLNILHTTVKALGSVWKIVIFK